MKLVSISGIVYFVKDVATTTDFYEKLGFIVADRQEDFAKVRLNWFWVEFVQIEKAEESVFAKEIAKDGGQIGGNGQYMHVAVDNVDEYYQKVLELGLEPASKPADFRWGRREFVLRDPDGYKLVFFEKIK